MSNIKGVWLLGALALSVGCSRGPVRQTEKPAQRLSQALVTAPDLDRTIVTTTGAQTTFLYTGSTPTQSGVAAGTIAVKLAAALTGKVIDRDTGTGLVNVTVKVLGMPELGSTQTAADGSYRMIVNGTRRITLDFSASNYFEGQRQVQASALQHASVADLALVQKPALPLAARAIPMSAGAGQLAASGAGRVYRGPTVTDTSGTRQLNAYFPPQARATTLSASGQAVPLASATVSAVEYTTGPNGYKAMPAELPPSTAYTYAAELTVAEGEGAVFDPPVPIYVDNFITLPIGTNVPSGFYDRTKGQWVAGSNGRVIKILSITAGNADLDVDGSGTAASAATLTAMGIADAERTQLAGLYTAGQAIWRVPVGHFSLWDFNLGFLPPSDAKPGSPGDDASDPGDRCEQSRHSTIECETQVLREELPIAGTAYEIQYRSDRVVGRTDRYSLKIPVTGATLPGALQSVQVELTVGGRTFTQTLPAQINQFFNFTWDGQDAFGRLLQGVQPAIVRVGNVYDAVYANSPRFGAPGGASTGVATRVQAALWGSRTYGLGVWDAKGEGLGGWNLSVHHVYDPVGKVVQLGSGAPQTSSSLAPVISTVAGTGIDGSSPDGTQATQAKLNPYDVAVAPDGTVFIAEQSCIRRVLPNGTLTTYAGSCGLGGTTGDGGLAINAKLFANSMVIAADGTMYLADLLNDRIRKIDPSTGIISLAVGTGTGGFSGDGGPATQAKIDGPRGMSLGSDGTLYFADTNNSRLRAMSTDGVVQTIAGNGDNFFPSGNDGPAVNAAIPSPVAVLALPDGSVLVSDPFEVRQVTVDGIIRAFAGKIGATTLGDGGPAIAAKVQRARDIELGPDGSIYIADGNSFRVRRVDNRGLISTVAGNGTFGSSGDGGPATAAMLKVNIFDGMAVTPDGLLYIADQADSRVRKIAGALPGVGVADIAIPSSDGGQVYVFNSDGKHLRTEDTFVRTTRPLYKFDYSTAGFLTAVTDVDGNVTTIQRDASGNPTGIRAPFGQLTTLALDAAGYVKTITNPASEATSFTYDSGGLMKTKTDPRGLLTNFTYDALGRLTEDADPAPATGFLSFARTDQATGWTVDETTTLNRHTSYKVEQLPNGDRKREVTQPSGVKASVVYGSDGKRTITRPDGTIITQTLSPDPRFGMLAAVVSTTRKTPSGLTRVENVSRSAVLSDPLNLLSLTSHTEQRVLNGRTYSTVFDAANKKFTTTSPELRQAVATLNASAHLATDRVADLLATQLGYDTNGRLTSRQQGARTTAFGYDPSSGYLTSLTDALTNQTNFVKDLLGRTTKTTYPDTNFLSVGYDADGNLSSITPPGQTAHGLAYDAVNLLQTYTPPAASDTGTLTTGYVYDADRALSTVTTPDGLSIQHAYDTAGRLATVTLPTGTVTYTYDATTGNISSIAGPYSETLTFGYDGELTTSNTWAGPVAGSVKWTFDNDFRVASEQVNTLTSAAFGYDGDSLLTSAGGLSITRSPTTGFVTGTTLSTVNDTFGYDSFGSLGSYTARTGTTAVYDETVTLRDALDRITTVTETVQGTATTYDYVYDTRGRLTDVNKNGAGFSHYDFDANGNRTAGPSAGVTATYDAQDRLLTSGGRTYTYGANGELKTKVESGQTTTYTYDVVGNLTQVALPGSITIDYIADAKGRRVGRKRNGALVQGFLYSNQLRIAAELDSTNGVVSTFTYGTKANVPDLMQKAGVPYRIITDHLGSVRLVVNANSGAVAQRIDYDEFGGIVADSSPGFQPFGFAGGLYDVDTKLGRFGARDYDPSVGRWVSKDPARFDGGQANLYVYAGNDPVNATDPSGQIPIISNLVCAYELWKLGDAYDDCHKELTDKLNRSTCIEDDADALNGAGNFSDAEMQCVKQRDPGRWSAALSWCGDQANQSMGAAGGGIMRLLQGG